MKIQELQELWKGQPFTPFTIHVADGRAFPVPHPDFLFLAGGGRKLIINSTADDSFNIVDPVFVTSVEVPASGADVSHSDSF